MRNLPTPVDLRGVDRSESNICKALRILDFYFSKCKSDVVKEDGTTRWLLGEVLLEFRNLGSNNNKVIVKFIDGSLKTIPIEAT